jgi:hypothetical protein
MAADLFGGWSPLPRTSIVPYRTTPVGYHIGWPEEYASPATKKSIPPEFAINVMCHSFRTICSCWNGIKSLSDVGGWRDPCSWTSIIHEEVCPDLANPLLRARLGRSRGWRSVTPPQCDSKEKWRAGWCLTGLRNNKGKFEVGPILSDTYGVPLVKQQ